MAEEMEVIFSRFLRRLLINLEGSGPKICENCSLSIGDHGYLIWWTENVNLWRKLLLSFVLICDHVHKEKSHVGTDSGKWSVASVFGVENHVMFSNVYKMNFSFSLVKSCCALSG